MRSKLIFFLGIVFLVGCIQPPIIAFYDVGLKEVERPASARERYGEQRISTVQEEGVNQYSFEDDLVKIGWFVSLKSISFAMTNKTDHTIKIIWDEAAYVDENGSTQRVMHSGVKYVDRNDPQPPSVIVRKGNLKDVIIPTNKIYYISGQYGGWREELLLQGKLGGTPEEVSEKAKGNIGKTIKVLLPLEIQGVLNEYLFTFKINSVTIK